MKTSRDRKHHDVECFEEDIKTEIDDKKQCNSNFISSTCNICQKVYESKAGLSNHIKSAHEEWSWSVYRHHDHERPVVGVDIDNEHRAMLPVSPGLARSSSVHPQWKMKLKLNIFKQ